VRGNKWGSLEAVKMEVDVTAAPAVKAEVLVPKIEEHVVQSPVKLKAKVVTDLVKGIPVL
jgi:hypothetical protein